MARKNALLRQDLSQQSQAAYKARNGAKAKGIIGSQVGFYKPDCLLTGRVVNKIELSLKAKEYGREMDRYNALAKDAAFRGKKAPG